MELLGSEGWVLLLRWVHIAAGITWIGILYYFNFVQAPFMNEVDATVKGTATRLLVPRALAWFRYAALVTVAAGLAIIIIRIVDGGVEILGTTYGTIILSGMILGILMFLNVWGVIWPKQKVVIASAEAAAGGGQADPAAADAGRRALLASRTNVLFSIPMLFFMAASSHGPLLARTASASDKTIYWIVAAALMLVIEANALVGLTGTSKKPLEKIGAVIWSGVILFVVLIGVFVVLTG
jgi:uncharacterized membrane protein